MKKIFVTFLFISMLIMSLQAQDVLRYHVFTIDESSGVVDSKGNEVLPPEYTDIVDRLPEKKQFVLHKEDADFVFDTDGGILQEYLKFKTRYITYENKLFSMVREKELTYLLSEEDSTRILLPKGRDAIFRTGNYYYNRNADGQKASSSAGFYFYTKPDAAKPMMTIPGDDMITCVEADEDREDDMVVSLENLKPFDYILFKKDNKLAIYDKKLKLLKTIKSDVNEPFEMIHEAEEAIQKILKPSNVISPMGLGVPSKVFPRLETDAARRVLYLVKRQDEKVPLFRTQYEIRPNMRDDIHYINIFDGNVFKGSFDIGPLDNPIIYLPKKYYSELKIAVDRVETDQSQK